MTTRTLTIACRILTTALFATLGGIGAQAETRRPRHVTPECEAAVKKGLSFLASKQGGNGS
ncbi:MAG: hypothetical protein O7D94_13040, partial [Planctomycetota bacterium]|nr:hypothetical protein [Planctomycetota bacterium]